MARRFQRTAVLLTGAVLLAGLMGGCRFALAQTIAAPGASTSRAGATVARAHRLLEQQHVAQAESVLQMLLARDPGNAPALELMGEIRERQSRSGEAEDFYRKALASDSTLLAARRQLGLLLLAGRHWEEAMSSLEPVLQARPDKVASNAEVESALAVALEARRRSDRDGALIALLRARKYVPDNVKLLVSLGILEDEMRLYKDADEALQRALLLEPSDPNALYAAARVQMDLQNLPQADTYFRAYLKQRPEDATAHYGLGRALLMAQKPAEARREFQRSVELRPQQVESYYQLGEIDLEAGRLESAQEYFQKALERDPQHGGAHCGLGMIGYRRKQYDKAVEELALAVQSAPDYQKARYYYGLALAKVGRKEDSERELAIATRLADEENRRQAGRLQLKGPLQTVPPASPQK